MTSRRGLSIRAAAPADAAALAELFDDVGYHVAVPALAERLEAIGLGAGTALAAWEWGPPSGVVVLHWYDGLHCAGRIAQIDLLLVASEGRRRGLGRLLVKAAAQAARVAGCAAMELSTGINDTQTTAFCTANGFEAAGLRFTRALRKAA